MLKDCSSYATVPAADFDRAKAWYKDKLGMTPERENMGGAIYATGAGTRFMLYPTQFAGTAKNTAISFNAKDFDGEMKALRAKGVKFEDYDFPGLKTVDGVAEFEGFKTAWFKDSEGNIIALAQDM